MWWSLKHQLELGFFRFLLNRFLWLKCNAFVNDASTIRSHTGDEQQGGVDFTSFRGGEVITHMIRYIFLIAYYKLMEPLSNHLVDPSSLADISIM